MNSTQCRQNAFSSQQFIPILQNPIPQQLIKIPQFLQRKIENKGDHTENLQFSSPIPFQDMKAFSQVATPKMKELKQITHQKQFALSSQLSTRGSKQLPKSVNVQSQIYQPLNQFYLPNNLPQNTTHNSELKASKYLTVDTETYQEEKKKSFLNYGKMQNLEEKIQQLVQENEKLNDILKQLQEKQINKQSNQEQNFSLQLDELQKKFEQLQNQNEIFQEQTLKQSEKIKQQHSDYEDQTISLAKLAKQNQELKQQLDERNQKVIQYQEERNKLLQQQIEQNKLDEVQIQLQKLEKTNNLLKQENAKQVQQIQEKEKAIAIEQKEKEQSQKQIVQQLQLEIGSLKKQQSELNMKLQEQQRNNELQEDIIQNLNYQITQLSNNNKCNEEEKLKLLQQQTESQKEQIKLLQTLLNEKSKELKELSAQKQQNVVEVNSADHLEEIQNQMQNLICQNQDLNIKLNEAYNQVKKANNNSTKWQTKYKQFKQAMKKIVSMSEKNTEQKKE